MEWKGKETRWAFFMVLQNPENGGGNIGGKERCELRACHTQKV